MRLPPQVCPGCEGAIYFRRKPGGRAVAIDADAKLVTIVTDECELVRGYIRHVCKRDSEAAAQPVDPARPTGRKPTAPAGRQGRERVVSAKASRSVPGPAPDNGPLPASEPIAAASESLSTKGAAE